jgi:hypothetical protein
MGYTMGYRVDSGQRGTLTPRGEERRPARLSTTMNSCEHG